MSLFGKQIKLLRKQKKLNQADLAEIIGLSQSYYSKLEKQEHEPTADIVILTSEFFNVSADWLLTGKEKTLDEPQWIKELTEEEKEDFETILKFLEFRREKKESRNTFTDYTDPSDDEPPIAVTKEEPIIYLPILGDAAAGNPIEIIEMKQGEIPVSEKHGKYNSFVVRAKGDSMIEDGIDNGDMVVVRPQPTVENGQIALINIDGEATIKRFYLHSQDKCELRSSNPAYPPMFFSPAKVSILGQIVEVIKRNQSLF